MCRPAPPAFRRSCGRQPTLRSGGLPGLDAVVSLRARGRSFFLPSLRPPLNAPSLLSSLRARPPRGTASACSLLGALRAFRRRHRPVADALPPSATAPPPPLFTAPPRSMRRPLPDAALPHGRLCCGTAASLQRACGLSGVHSPSAPPRQTVSARTQASGRLLLGTAPASLRHALPPPTSALGRRPARQAHVLCCSPQSRFRACLVRGDGVARSCMRGPLTMPASHSNDVLIDTPDRVDIGPIGQLIATVARLPQQGSSPSRAAQCLRYGGSQ